MSRGWTYVSGDWNLKTCSKCKQELSLDNFYNQKDGKFGVTSRCKPCVLESNSKWKEKNLEKYKNAITNWAAVNREICYLRTRAWRKQNLEYDAFRARTYRAKKLQRIPSWANILKIKQVYLECPTGLHVDHIIPLQGKLVSGLHVENNLQYLSPKENMAKRNKYHV